MSTVPQDTRICGHCKQPLPVDSFYIKDKRTGRRNSRCKACLKQYAAVKYAENPGRFIARVLSWRAGNPEAYAAIARRYRDKHPDRLTESSRRYDREHADRRAQYRATHADERRAYNDAYRDEHHEDCLAYNRSYYRARRDEIQAKQRQYREEHPGRLSETAKRCKIKHKDSVVAYNHRWRQEHRELCNTYKSKHRAHKIANGGSHTVAEWGAILERYGHRCLACGCTDKKLTVDHVIPLASGGTDYAYNLQPLCLRCNGSKGNRTIDYRSR